MNGKAEIVVQDAETYQELLDLVDAVETIAAVKNSLAAFDRGEGVPGLDALEALRAKHGIPRRD